MIPQEKLAAVTRGFREAFGAMQVEDIRPVAGGLSSALKYRIVVGRRPYLLRVIVRTDAINDPTRQFECMRTAAAAGLAPSVRYASIEDRICITDFVEAVAFPMADALVRMPAVLRVLHSLPPPARTLNYETLDGFVRKFRAANLLPDGETAEVLAQYARAASIYPREEADMVSSHNDLKPENFLFDGQRVWLVDWEAAFLNDRYFDLAVVANFVVDNEEGERAYLQAYLGQAPDEYQLARFFLMRQLLHAFAAAIYLLLGCQGKPVDGTEEAPDFRDFHRRIWAGEIDLMDNNLKAVYGRVHWEQLSRNVAQARFEEALRIVSDRNPREGFRRLVPVAE